MAKSFSLIEYYPDRWRELKEIQAICDSDIIPVDGDDTHTLPHLWDCLDADMNSVFILPYGDEGGADEYACSRWESILGIVPANDMTLADRQFNIHTKLFTRPPYSYKHVVQMLDNLMEEGTYAISRDVGAKTLNVRLALSSRFQVEAVSELLDNMVPANMGLNIIIVYTTHDHMSQHTHDELSVYTHNEIKVTQMYDDV